MLVIDPDVKSTYPFKFLRAIRKARNCAAYRMQETFRVNNAPGRKGDWLVIDRGEFKVMPHHKFVVEYGTKETPRPCDKKRIPKVNKGDVVDAEHLGVGMRGRTDIKKSKGTSTYFIDDRDSTNPKEDMPYSYFTIHCPFSPRGETSGAYIEDILDVLMDHVASAQTKKNGARVRHFLELLHRAKGLAALVGEYQDPLDFHPERSETVQHGQRGCCGGDK